MVSFQEAAFRAETQVVAAEYNEVHDFSQGLAAVCKDGKWGFINRKGEIVIAPVYGWQTEQDGTEQAFHNGRAKIEVNGKSGYIDKNGTMVIPPQFSLAYPCSEGLAAVTKAESMDTDWGYVDSTGKWVIPPSFRGARPGQEAAHEGRTEGHDRPELLPF